MSGVVYLGSKSAGACLPSSLQAKAALDAAIGVSLPKVQAQLAGLIKLQAQLNLTPPTLTASLDAAVKIVGGIEAAISLGMPGVDLQLLAVAGLLAQLQIEFGELTASLGFSAGFGLTLGASGIHLYAYQGEAAQLGPAFLSELSTGFPGGQPDDQSYAVMLATSVPNTKIALETLFGVSFDID